MRKVGRAFGFTKEASKKNVAKDVGKNIVEFWSLGELDAVSVKVYAGEAPTTCLVEVMPPQSTDRGLDPALGAYCLLIDVSYSMSHEAQVTTDEGEKTGFGYSLLDIAKHATSTFISTMSDGDYVTIVTYSSSVRTVQERIACPGGRARLVTLPGCGLQLTEWHPVLDAATGRFRFPAHLGAPAAVRRCAHVYNLVLAPAAEPVPLVNGVGCVALGHGLRGPVVGHAYYGTGAVLKDLAQQPGWREGRVCLAAPLLPPPAA